MCEGGVYIHIFVSGGGEEECLFIYSYSARQIFHEIYPKNN